MKVGTLVRLHERMEAPTNQVGKVTSEWDAPSTPAGPMDETHYFAVRWPDGSQSAHEEHELIYADHPDFESTEEVEAWLRQ